MNMKIALVLGALLVLIIGVSCSTDIDFNHNDAQHIKHSGVAVKEISNSSFEKVYVEKTAAAPHKSANNTKTVKKATVVKSNANIAVCFIHNCRAYIICQLFRSQVG